MPILYVETFNHRFSLTIVTHCLDEMTSKYFQTVLNLFLHVMKVFLISFIVIESLSFFFFFFFFFFFEREFIVNQDQFVNLSYRLIN